MKSTLSKDVYAKGAGERELHDKTPDARLASRVDCAPAPEFSIKDQSPIPAVLKMNLTLPVAPEAMPEKLL